MNGEMSQRPGTARSQASASVRQTCKAMPSVVVRLDRADTVGFPVGSASRLHPLVEVHSLAIRQTVKDDGFVALLRLLRGRSEVRKLVRLCRLPVSEGMEPKVNPSCMQWFETHLLATNDLAQSPGHQLQRHNQHQGQTIASGLQDPTVKAPLAKGFNRHT
jgi:hypothetical protein